MVNEYNMKGLFILALLVLVIVVVAPAEAVDVQKIRANCTLTEDGGELACGATVTATCDISTNYGSDQTVINEMLIRIAGEDYTLIDPTSGNRTNGTWTKSIIIDASTAVSGSGIAKWEWLGIWDSQGAYCGAEAGPTYERTACFFEFTGGLTAMNFLPSCECAFSETVTACALDDTQTITYTPNVGCTGGEFEYSIQKFCDRCVTPWVAEDVVCNINRSEGDGFTGTGIVNFIPADGYACCTLTHLDSDCTAPVVDNSELTCNQGYWLSEYNDVSATRKNAGTKIFAEEFLSTSVGMASDGFADRQLQPIVFDVDNDGVVETVVFKNTGSAGQMIVYNPDLDIEETQSLGGRVVGDAGLYEFDARQGLSADYIAGNNGAGIAVIVRVGGVNNMELYLYTGSGFSLVQSIPMVDATLTGHAEAASVFCDRDFCYSPVGGGFTLRKVDVSTFAASAVGGGHIQSSSEDWRNMPAKVPDFAGAGDIIVFKGKRTGGNIAIFACNTDTTNCGYFEIGTTVPGNVSEIYIGAKQYDGSDYNSPIYVSFIDSTGDVVYYVGYAVHGPTPGFNYKTGITKDNLGSLSVCAVAPAAAECTSTAGVCSGTPTFQCSTYDNNAAICKSFAGCNYNPGLFGGVTTCDGTHVCSGYSSASSCVQAGCADWGPSVTDGAFFASAWEPDIANPIGGVGFEPTLMQSWTLPTTNLSTPAQYGGTQQATAVRGVGVWENNGKDYLAIATPYYTNSVKLAMNTRLQIYNIASGSLVYQTDIDDLINCGSQIGFYANDYTPVYANGDLLTTVGFACGPSQQPRLAAYDVSSTGLQFVTQRVVSGAGPYGLPIVISNSNTPAQNTEFQAFNKISGVYTQWKVNSTNSLVWKGANIATSEHITDQENGFPHDTVNNVFYSPFADNWYQYEEDELPNGVTALHTGLEPGTGNPIDWNQYPSDPEFLTTTGFIILTGGSGYDNFQTSTVDSVAFDPLYYFERDNIIGVVNNSWASADASDLFNIREAYYPSSEINANYMWRKDINKIVTYNSSTRVISVYEVPEPVHDVSAIAVQEFVEVGCYVSSISGGAATLTRIGGTVLPISNCPAQMLSADVDRDGADELIFSTGAYEYKTAELIESFNQNLASGIAIVDITSDSYLDMVFVTGLAVTSLISLGDFNIQFGNYLTISDSTCSADNLDGVITVTPIGITAKNPDSLEYRVKLLDESGIRDTTSWKASFPVLVNAPQPGVYTTQMYVRDTASGEEVYNTCEVTVAISVENLPQNQAELIGLGTCTLGDDGEFNFYDSVENHNWLLALATGTLNDGVAQPAMGGGRAYFATEDSAILHGLNCAYDSFTAEFSASINEDTRSAFTVYATAPDVTVTTGYQSFGDPTVLAESGVELMGSLGAVPAVYLIIDSSVTSGPRACTVAPCLYAQVRDEGDVLIATGLSTTDDVVIRVTLETARQVSDTLPGGEQIYTNYGVFTVFVDGVNIGTFDSAMEFQGHFPVIEFAHAGGFGFTDLDYIRTAAIGLDGELGEVTDTRSEDDESTERVLQTYASDCAVVDGYGNLIDRLGRNEEYLAGYELVKNRIDSLCSDGKYIKDNGAYCSFEELRKIVKFNNECYKAAHDYCIETTYPRSAGFNTEDIDVQLSDGSLSGAAACGTALAITTTAGNIGRPFFSIMWNQFTQNTAATLFWVFIFFLVIIAFARQVRR